MNAAKLLKSELERKKLGYLSESNVKLKFFDNHIIFYPSQCVKIKGILAEWLIY